MFITHFRIVAIQFSAQLLPLRTLSTLSQVSFAAGFWDVTQRSPTTQRSLRDIPPQKKPLGRRLPPPSH